jgi:hypothetical protein
LFSLNVSLKSCQYKYYSIKIIDIENEVVKMSLFIVLGKNRSKLRIVSPTCDNTNVDISTNCTEPVRILKIEATRIFGVM